MEKMKPFHYYVQSIRTHTSFEEENILKGEKGNNDLICVKIESPGVHRIYPGSLLALA